MLVFYVGMKYDYCRPEQGYSFEHYNFVIINYLPLTYVH